MTISTATLKRFPISPHLAYILVRTFLRHYVQVWYFLASKCLNALPEPQIHLYRKMYPWEGGSPSRIHLGY